MVDQNIIKDQKNLVLETAQKLLPDAIKTARQIFDWKEISGQEIKSSQLLTDILKKAGAQVDVNVGGMPTAFRASFGIGHPRIALLAEYDALPEVGHACGHNLSGTASVYAAVALAQSGLIKKLPGSLVVVGTPMEEAGGGKIRLVQAGVFRSIDAALMTHTGRITQPAYRTVASQGFKIILASTNKEWRRRRPNLMDVLAEVLMGIRAVKNQSSVGTTIMWAVPEAGKQNNIMPERAVIDIGIWSYDDEVLERTIQRIKDRTRKAIHRTPVKLTMDFYESRYMPFEPNSALIGLFEKNLRMINTPYEPRQGRLNDSIDTGNVSQVVPTLHADIALTEVQNHTTAYATACNSAEGEKSIAIALSSLALTAYDLLSNPEYAKRAKEDFEERVHKKKEIPKTEVVLTQPKTETQTTEIKK